ncbi:MAG: cytochrome B [Flavobacteriales bacterium]|nr:cytochrome B [Flavobacteriales bacterium]
MFNALLGLHSTFRYVILILLISAIVKSISGWLQKGDYKKGHDKLSLFTMIFAQIQMTIGLILYFTSDIVSIAHSDFGAAMKVPALRFWGVEHIFGMLIAVTLITLGRRVAKNANEDVLKHRKTAIYFICALVIIFITIPWPFSEVARGYFFSS